MYIGYIHCIAFLTGALPWATLIALTRHAAWTTPWHQPAALPVLTSRQVQSRRNLYA